MDGGMDLQKPGTSKDVEMTAIENNGNDSNHSTLVSEYEPQEESTPESKRRRGRPRVVSTKLRTRESIRLKNALPAKTHENDERVVYQWSIEEKEQLLRGLHEVGSNPRQLMPYVPSRCYDEILKQVQMWRRFAIQEVKQKCEYDRKRTGRSSNVTHLDDWLKHIEDKTLDQSPRLFALSNVFMLMSEYGKFPSVEESNGFDFRAMYHYIHNMLNGLPLYGLDPLTAKVINHTLYDLSKMVRVQNISSALRTILTSEVGLTRSSVRSYGRSKLPPSSKVTNLWSHRDTNPLNVPPTFVAKKATETSDNESYDGD